MNKNLLTESIEAFAPPDLAENWDCSGWVIKTDIAEVFKVFLCLTVTEDTYKQAVSSGCDMIISHHPLFVVPLAYKNLQIYCAHTNMDNAIGGTTDTIIDLLGLSAQNRVVTKEFRVEEFAKKLKKISPNLRIVNNKNVKTISRIGFCAGSGADYIENTECDAFVTGDIKYHCAVEADKVLFDIGHFESEIPILGVFKKLIKNVEVVVADEKSPFIVM